MLDYQYSKSLTQLNTLNLKSSATWYTVLREIEELERVADFIDQKRCRSLVLGCGSNIVLPELYDGLVLHNKLQGITVIAENTDTVLVKAMAGEIWDNFVVYCLEHQWFGLENLSFIPGTVGASPIQNIGAYGVEVGQFIEYVEIYDLYKRVFLKVQSSECDFGYRTSKFKYQNGYVITSVVFRLFKYYNINATYPDLQQLKKHSNEGTLNALALRNYIIDIRQSKLPDPQYIANAGSFFHNPILPDTHVNCLKRKYPQMPVYSVSNHGCFKVAAGWLIDNLGLSGYKCGNVGVYKKQALILVNYADANQAEILRLAQMVQNMVEQEYQILLNIEPIVIN
jgi:UDP-N-acetylmuramate dehydrogenase